MSGRSKLIDLTGERYGRLTVTEFSHFQRSPSGHKNAYWKCICDCGAVVVKPTFRLRSGNVKSCGCFKVDEIRRTRTKPFDRRLYGVYDGMLKRCYDPRFEYYSYYGGRGITICEEWLGDNGLDNFRRWAMQNGYRRGLTIERKNNDEGYSPDNCAWVDRFEQGKNKRNNILVTINGETKILAEWCRILDVPYWRVKRRRRSPGWSTVEALLVPPLKGKTTKEEMIKKCGLESVLSNAYSHSRNERVVMEND